MQNIHSAQSRITIVFVNLSYFAFLSYEKNEGKGCETFLGPPDYQKNIDFDDDMMIKENGDILPRYVLGCISPPTSRFPSVGTNQYTPVYVFNPQVVWFRRVLKSINFLLLNFQGP